MTGVIWGLLWGLLAAVLIGASDCIARVTSARVTASVLITIIMGASSIALLAWILATGHWPEWHLRAWLVSLLSGALNMVVLALLYRALERGPVSVASPAASVFVVLLVGLNTLAGEPWTGWQMVSVLFVFVGVIMLSRHSEAVDVDANYDARWLRITALYGLAAATAVAVRMFFAQEASDILGPGEALFLNRVFALLTSMLWIGWQASRAIEFKLPHGKTRWLVAAQAVLETLAFAAFLYGSVVGERVATTIGFSAFVATTTLFARFWLGEKVGLYRSIWIVVIAAGVLLAVAG